MTLESTNQISDIGSDVSPLTNQVYTAVNTSCFSDYSEGGPACALTLPLGECNTYFLNKRATFLLSVDVVHLG